MTEQDVEDDYPAGAGKSSPGEKTPDYQRQTGPQFIAKDFKQFHSPLRHDPRAGPVRTIRSPNGKLERWHGSIKRECIRPAAIGSLDDARRRVADYVNSL